MRVVKAVVLAVVLAAVVVMAVEHGRSEAFKPTVPKLEATTGFSLGSVKPTVFAKRPSAQQLYDAVLKLYGSFDSVAAAYKRNECEPREYSVTEDGKAIDVQSDTEASKDEYRYIRHDKQMIVSSESGKVKTVNAINGSGIYFYYPQKDRLSGSSIPVTRKHNLLVNTFSLVPGSSRDSVSQTRLLPDASVGGTQVYVLELRWDHKPPPNRKNVASDPCWTEVQLYVGKKDLLPRRIVAQEQSAYSEKLGIFDSRATWDFTGFKVNVKVPGSLFEFELPKGE